MHLARLLAKSAADCSVQCDRCCSTYCTWALCAGVGERCARGSRAAGLQDRPAIQQSKGVAMLQDWPSHLSGSAAACMFHSQAHTAQVNAKPALSAPCMATPSFPQNACFCNYTSAGYNRALTKPILACVGFPPALSALWIDCQ